MAAEPHPRSSPPALQPVPGDELVVATEVRELAPAPLPAAQAAAVAAAGFVTGVATLALFRRRAGRRAQRRGRPASEVLPVVASRSILVDVHIVGRE
jgi:hypothetical protein